MATTPLSAFESSLDDLDVPVTRVSPGEFPCAVTDAVEGPAVGVELDDVGSDVSLDGTPVDVDPTPAALREATTGVTGARLGVADYGSVVLALTDRASELVSLFVERHVVVLREGDVVPDMDAAVDALDEEFSRTRGSAVLATGPSATADMGALVKGAHGPREVRVVVLTEGR